jgi:hypothetical protein
MAALGDDGGVALARRAVAAFRHLPEVHTVGIGGRIRNGEPTGELVLKVFVSTKRPRSELSPDALVPAEFEGVPTDVVEAPSSQPAAAVPGAQLGGPYSEDSGRYRPLRGGVQLAGEHCFGKGTLGFIARVDEPPPERIVAVTVHHALFSSVAAEMAELRVGQPTGDESVTKCCRGIFGKFLMGFRDATMDAAVIRLEAKTEYYLQIEDIGITNSDHAITAAEAQTGTYLVRKRGRTTRVTGGKISAIHATHASGSPSNYMVIEPSPSAVGTATFADWGDSGAAVVNEQNEVVGLLFGMASLTAGQPQAGWGFAWGIEEVKARFTANGLDLIVPVGTLNEKRIVAVRPDDSAQASLQPVPEGVRIAGEIERDLETSELGRLAVALWLRHSAELNQLVNGSRKIATRWHRLGGPALMQAALRTVYSAEARLPERIGVRSADECLSDILDLLVRYGSPTLREDIHAYRAHLPPISGRSYAEILDIIRGSQGGQPWHA